MKRLKWVAGINRITKRFKAIIVMLAMVLSLMPSMTVFATEFNAVKFTYNFDPFTGNLTSIDVTFNYTNASNPVAKNDWGIGIFTRNDFDVSTTNRNRKAPASWKLAEACTRSQASYGTSAWGELPIVYGVGNVAWAAGSGSKSMRLDMTTAYSHLDPKKTYYIHILMRDANACWLESGNTKGYTSKFTVADILAERAKLHVHTFSYAYQDDGATLVAYCNNNNGYACPYYGTNVSNARSLIKVGLNAEDGEYKRGMYHYATIPQSQISNLESLTKLTTSDITYYKVDAEGATTGGTLVSKPTDVGYYYATATIGSSYTKKKAFKIGPVSDRNYNLESLNNQVSDEGKLIHSTASNPHASLQVNVNYSTDRVTRYKIADLPWNEVNGDYELLKWVDQAQNFTTSTAGVSKGYNTDTYSSPEILASATQKRWEDFYNDMLTNTGNIINQESNPLLPVTDCVNVAPTGAEGEYHCTFENLDFGTYAVIAHRSDGNGNLGAPYALIIENIVPERVGPGYNNYTVLNEFEVFVKGAAASIEKKINGEDVATIGFGKQVSFTVDCHLPSLSAYADRKTTGSGSNPYTLKVDDHMNEAFALCTEEGVASNDAGNIKVYYMEPGEDSNPAVKTLLPTTDFTYTENPSATVTGKLYTITVNPNEVVKDSEGRATDQKETLVTVSFNVRALKSWLESSATKLENISDTHIYIEYEALTTEKAKVDSESNTNNAKLIFEVNAEGETAYVEDTVNGYCYGMQLIKKDGQGDENGEDIFLSKVEFELFKEICSFKYVTTEDNSGYIFAHDANGNGDTSEKYESYEYYSSHLDTYYFLEDYDNGDLIYRIFEQVEIIEDGTDKGKTIVTNGLPTGNIITGLDLGNYILVETKPILNYNELAEDIYFEIKPVELDEAELINNGSLSIFKDMEGTIIENGLIEVTVLNFRGLMLPSTGGAGTLIFSIVGIVAMVSVTIIALAIRRKRSMEYYM